MEGKKKHLEELARSIIRLNQDDFRDVMCTIIQHNPHPEVTNYLKNKLQKASVKPSKPKAELKVFEKPPTPQLKPGRDGKPGSSRAVESSLSASLLPDLHGISAWKVPVIFRGDLIPNGGKVYIDIEKLTMKTSWLQPNPPMAIKKKHQNLACNVAIVDEKGTLLFWAFIHRDPADVCQYFSSIHRITKNKVLTGVQIETVRELLQKCIQGNTVVGAKLADDLKSLSTRDEIEKKRYFSHDKCIDIQYFYRDQDGEPFKLKDLANHFFPNQKRSFQSDFHTSISDARMTMKLYLEMCELQLKNPSMTDASELGIVRSKRDKFKNAPGDFCRCNKK